MSESQRNSRKSPKLRLSRENAAQLWRQRMINLWKIRPLVALSMLLTMHYGLQSNLRAGFITAFAWVILSLLLYCMHNARLKFYSAVREANYPQEATLFSVWWGVPDALAASVVFSAMVAVLYYFTDLAQATMFMVIFGSGVTYGLYLIGKKELPWSEVEEEP